MRVRAHLVVLLALLAFLPVAGQNFIFVSPNTSEQLPLAKAEAALNSPGEQRMLAAAQYVLCRLGSHGEAKRAIGVWVGSAENSIVLQTSVAEPSLGYAAAWLGRFGSQRTVLAFERKAGGRDRLYRLEFPGIPDHDVITVAEKNRLIDMTLIPGSAMTLLISGSPADRKHVEDAAQALKVPPHGLTEFEGTAHLLGDGFDREKGRQMLNTVATEFEKQHPELERRACGAAPK
jgi:hypothetical protein